MEIAKQVNENCLYCGTSLNGMCQPDKRKYCSVTCSNKYRLRQKKPEVQAKLWQHAPAIFEEAMNMYWNGSSGATIAREYEIPVGTVYSWIHDFGKQKERADPAALPRSIQLKVVPLKEQFRMAQTADEWREALQGQIAQDETRNEETAMYLVCRLLQGQSVNKLASVIFENLKADPLSGNVFAFCNKCRNIITTISWKEPLYSITKHIKAHGTFYWPHEDLGDAIEVTKTGPRPLGVRKNGAICGFCHLANMPSRSRIQAFDRPEKTEQNSLRHRRHKCRKTLTNQWV